MGFAARMTAQTLIRSAADGLTERFDPTACLDERVRHRALLERPSPQGQAGTSKSRAPSARC